MIYDRSHHQQMVEAFMLRAHQDVPLEITEPTKEVRLLRAKLILEEALETLSALGVFITDISDEEEGEYFVINDFTFHDTDSFNMIDVIDGCCDLRVVTTGTMSACGLPDNVFQNLVDTNNLNKFREGHEFRDDGKLMKPPGHRPPPIAEMLQLYRDVTEHRE